MKMFSLKYVPNILMRTYLSIDKQAVAYVVHTVIIAVMVETLKLCFSTCITWCTSISYFALVLIVSHFSYDFVKDYYLKGRINPENKAVLITGCDSGFGHLLAKRLDSKGFHVFASCLMPDGSGAKQLKDTCSPRMQVLQLDVTKDAEVKDAVAFVEKNLESKELWAIVNNAGIQKGFDTEFSCMQDFRDTMDVNVFGMIRVTKAFLPLLRRSKGRVINMTSLLGRVSAAGLCPYIMSKFAAVAFTECLGQEMEVWGGKVISVEPELFRTPLANLSAVLQRLETSVSNLSEDVRADYGESYFQRYKLWLTAMTNLGSRKTHVVVDALETAVSAVHPDSVYRPRRNALFRILIYILEYGPKKLTMGTLNAIYYSAGLAIPEKAGETFDKYFSAFRKKSPPYCKFPQ